MQFSFPAAKILQKLHICKHSGVFLAKKIEFILLFYARRWLWMLAYGRHLGAQNRGFTLFAKKHPPLHICPARCGRKFEGVPIYEMNPKS